MCTSARRDASASQRAQEVEPLERSCKKSSNTTRKISNQSVSQSVISRSRHALTPSPAQIKSPTCGAKQASKQAIGWLLECTQSCLFRYLCVLTN